MSARSPSLLITVTPPPTSTPPLTPVSDIKSLNDIVGQSDDDVTTLNEEKSELKRQETTLKAVPDIEARLSAVNKQATIKTNAYTWCSRVVSFISIGVKIASAISTLPVYEKGIVIDPTKYAIPIACLAAVVLDLFALAYDVRGKASTLKEIALRSASIISRIKLLKSVKASRESLYKQVSHYISELTNMEVYLFTQGIGGATRDDKGIHRRTIVLPAPPLSPPPPLPEAKAVVALEVKGDPPPAAEVEAIPRMAKVVYRLVE